MADFLDKFTDPETMRVLYRKWIDMGDGTFALRMAVANADGSLVGGPASPIALVTSSAATGTWVSVPKGTYTWTAKGTFDGATAKLQYSTDGGTSYATLYSVSEADLDDGETATGYSYVALSSGHVRVAISGAGGSTSLSSDLRSAG